MTDKTLYIYCLHYEHLYIPGQYFIHYIHFHFIQTHFSFHLEYIFNCDLWFTVVCIWTSRLTTCICKPTWQQTCLWFWCFVDKVGWGGFMCAFAVSLTIALSLSQSAILLVKSISFWKTKALKKVFLNFINPSFRMQT